MNEICELIKKSPKILLTTHRHCDGDGLGAELAMFQALKKMGKSCQIINVDRTPKKYRFLKPDLYIKYFEDSLGAIEDFDLALIFDTNDERLIEPLMTEIKKKCKRIAFIDHHPELHNGPQPSPDSYIDVDAASAGEVVYRIIKKLGIEFNDQIAKALYTSITFDTQLYRFIRSSAQSHLIAAELLKFKIDTEEVHHHLFGHFTKEKIAFLSKAFSQIEYFHKGLVAVLVMNENELSPYNMEMDESRDIIDLLMNIDSIEAAIVLSHVNTDKVKISLRSKGKIKVLPIAEQLGGGGHHYSAGVTTKMDLVTAKQFVLDQLKDTLENK